MQNIKLDGWAYFIEQIQIYDNSSTGRTKGNSAGPLTVLDSHGRKIDKNVYAATITIWNDGNSEIRRDDVRVPFKINTGSEAKILDLSPVQFSRENADKFSLDDGGTISWEHFDPGEGLTIRIMYEAPSMTNLAITGYAINIGESISYDQIRRNVVKLPIKLSALENIGLIVAVTLGGFLAFGLFLSFENKLLFTWFVVTVLILIAVGVYFIVQRVTLQTIGVAPTLLK